MKEDRRSARASSSSRRSSTMRMVSEDEGEDGIEERTSGPTGGGGFGILPVGNRAMSLIAHDTAAHDTM